jgi:hypothetical protein
MVTKTGVVLEYFVSATEFEEHLKVRDLLPKARFAWEMPVDPVGELEKPLNRRRSEFDALMEERGLGAPEPGLVIPFVYLWRREREAGEESGRKSALSNRRGMTLDRR